MHYCFKHLLLAGASLLCLSASAQDQGLTFPESVISDGKYLYVDNIGEGMNPGTKDGNGYISKLSLDGKLITKSITTEKLDAPKGSAIVDGVLYVADIDRIVGIDLKTGNKTAELSFASEKTSFLNDVVAKDAHTLFVSATDVGKVYEVTLGRELSYKTLPVAVAGANGMVYDPQANKLYTCGFEGGAAPTGILGEISWKNGQASFRRIGTEVGYFDGLQLLDAHTLLVSDWANMTNPAGAGIFKKVDVQSGQATEVLKGVSGPADFYYDAAKQTVITPAMLESKILFKQL